MNNQTIANPSVYGIRIYPTHAVKYKVNLSSVLSQGGKVRTLTELQKAAKEASRKNLENNSHDGNLSKKASSKIKNAINWLVLASEEKIVVNPINGSKFKFICSFITLTLPALQGSFTDNYIKKEVLNPFLTLLRNKYNFRLYVWRAEAQSNGNIHFHIICNTFINYSQLRYMWNRLLLKKGLMDSYTNKYSKMSEDMYVSEMVNKFGYSAEMAKKSFLAGSSSGWVNPNTTDVHSVKNVKDLASYVSTYMAKKDEGKRKIIGRLWGCSYELSHQNKCTFEYQLGDEQEDVLDLYNSVDEVKNIESDTEIDGVRTVFAEVFIYRPSKIFKVFKGRLLALLERYILKLKGVISMFDEFESLVVNENKSLVYNLN